MPLEANVNMRDNFWDDDRCVKLVTQESFWNCSFEIECSKLDAFPYLVKMFQSIYYKFFNQLNIEIVSISKFPWIGGFWTLGTLHVYHSFVWTVSWSRINRNLIFLKDLSINSWGSWLNIRPNGLLNIAKRINYLFQKYMFSKNSTNKIFLPRTNSS